MKNYIYADIKNKIKTLYATYFWKYQEDKFSKEELDNEYKKGIWNYLAGITELSRFSVVVGYCHFLKDYPSILEIGCGEGVLCRRLCPSKYERFIGIDIAPEAIKRAKELENSKNRFICSDAWNFKTDEKFDIIVFNECLNYISDTIGLIKKYAKCLNDDGVFIASIHSDYKRSTYIGNAIKANFQITSETTVKNELNQQWCITVFKSNSTSSI
jgi:SAM-dependent methyltransferase